MRPLSAPYRLQAEREPEPAEIAPRRIGSVEILIASLMAVCKVVFVLVVLATLGGLPRPVPTMIMGATALVVWRTCIYVLHVRGWVLRPRSRS